ncbi:MAG: hypothetical protein JWO36_4495 [Myxococcales bacterium]|nr:hypothetical protein [Myxococcales bacterium]
MCDGLRPGSKQPLGAPVLYDERVKLTPHVERRHYSRASDTGAKAVVLARVSQTATFDVECLSAGGARLLGHLSLVSGEKIKMLIELDGIQISVEARVLRTDVGDDRSDRFAVAFQNLPPQIQDRIQRFVDDLVERQRIEFLTDDPTELRPTLDDQT